jgi:hypothetical protein
MIFTKQHRKILTAGWRYLRAANTGRSKNSPGNSVRYVRASRGPDRICGDDVPDPKAWEHGCLVSAQKPFYLIFSSLQSSFEREILVRTNTFYIFFGTEALKARILVHEKQHLPGNLVS